MPAVQFCPLASSKGDMKMEELKKPDGWPKDVPLPSMEEIKQVVQDGEKMIEDISNQMKGKLKGPSPEMLNTQITI